MTVQETLADAVLSCKGLAARFLPGFTEANRTAQAEHLPNHVMWTLGHVSLYLHDAAGRIDGRSRPESDFGPSTGRSVDRYSDDAIGFNSKPVNDPSRYPTLARGVAIFNAACDRLAAVVSKADDATLAKKIDWFGMQIPLASLVTRVMFHVGVHTGEILDLRRALGFDRVLKM
ncbi:MAG TPA: DinB family protein [Phycisphaerae bacterium]|nr:DinB family protein [Phycisphaerae bacterium]